MLFQQLGAGHAEIFTSRLDPVLRALQALGLIGALGSLLALGNLVRAWKRITSWPVRLLNAAVALASLGFAWFGAVSGLLRQSLHY